MIDLEQMVKDAYTDPKVLEQLIQAHDFYAWRVINRILEEHFTRINNKQIPLWK
jgi:hypothetical protein